MVDQPQESDAMKFLERDFNQCFAQMRHYDARTWEICKFTFTAYTALIGISIGLYKYSVEKEVDLRAAALAALSIGIVVGLFMFCQTIRNRVYAVVVTRYVNEHRRHFLSCKPSGFLNETKMHVNPSQPPYFNWRSSQSWFSYLLAGLNSTLVGTLVFIALASSAKQWLWTILAFVVVFIAQSIPAILYLRTREGKSASKAVFGED